MAHQYSRVGFKLSVEVNEVNLSLSYGGVIFDLLFTYFSHQGNVTKIPSAHISLTYIHVFCLPYWLFLPYQFWKKYTNSSGTVSLWYESWRWFLFAPFWNNQKITKWWAKFKLECLLLICTYTNATFIVVCKPRTLNDGGEDSVQYRNRKKHCFLAGAILLFIGKIIIFLFFFYLIASLSHLEALCLNVTLNRLTIAYSKI